MLILHLYVSVLPLLKRYTVMFQTKEPMLHRATDEQLRLMKEFVMCFIQPNALMNKSVKQIVQLDLSAPSNCLPDKDMFVGPGVKKLCESADIVVLSFIKTARKTFMACGSYLQLKMPVTNKILRHVSAHDPFVKAQGHALQYMLALPSLATNVLMESEEAAYDLEVCRLHIDNALPEATCTTRLDICVSIW